MKVHVFVTRLTQLNHYLSSFPPDTPGQEVEPLPDYMVKEILFYAMPDPWHKRMTEQGYNYMDDAITLYHMADFFETRCENLEVKPTGKKSSKDDKKASKKRKAVQFATSDEETSALC